MIVFSYIVLSLLLSVFILLFFIFGIDALRGHDMATSKRVIKVLVKIIKEHNPGTHRFYDLGCGRGSVVLVIKKEFPLFMVYGIDNNIVRIFFSKLRSKFLRRKIIFKKQNIFNVDLKNVDIIYAYLWYELMPPLEKKLRKELKQGAIVVTNTSRFLTWKPIKTYIVHPENPDFEKLFVYIKTSN